MTRGARRAIATGAALLLALAALLAALLREDRFAEPARGGPLAPPGRGGLADAPRPAPPAIAVPGAAPSAPARAEATLEPAVVEGRVVSTETGRGVPGADVTFSRGGAAAGARTGADGSFRFEPPVEGRWLLAAVTAPGFLPFAPEWGHSPVTVDAQAGRPVRGVELRLAPARPIAGKVLAPDGAPAAGAEVRLLGVHAEAALVPLADRFTADAAGVFRFSAPRGAIVEATKPGFAPGRAEVDAVATVEGRLVVRLRDAKGAAAAPAGRIAGRVVERGTGAPIAGALVVAERGTRFGLVPAGQAVSGTDGRFAVADLAGGSYRLTATADGRARASAGPIEAGAPEVTLELARGGALRGCVRDGTSGQPVTSFTVSVTARRPGGPRAAAVARSFLDGSGCWSVADVSPGPATVSVAALGFMPAPDVAVDVPESGEALADVRLARGRRLRGVVVDAAQRTPVAGALVALQWNAPEAGSVLGASEEAWTDAEGRFELSGLAHRFSLEVTAPGHHVRIAGGLEVPEGAAAGPVIIAVTPLAPGEEPQREITGIGVGIAPRDGALVVTGVMAGGGAAAAGIAEGDAIVRVDGVPVSELGFSGAANAIRGPEGTSVRLSLKRGDGTLDVWVGRGIVRG
jgi:hypothetical protein